jgi:hypothetical protein
VLRTASGAIVVFHHVVEHVVPAVASGVHMRVDKAGRHELATYGVKMAATILSLPIGPLRRGLAGRVYL